MRHSVPVSMLAALAALAVACPKQPPPPQPTPEPERGPVVSIRSIDPDSTREGVAVTVTVTGFGFDREARVFLGSREMPGVDVVDDGELTFRAKDDLPAGSYDVRVVRADGEDAVAVDGFAVARRKDDGDCALRIVYFDFNESGLTNEARQALADNASCLESRGVGKLRLEGHADERGSTEYNLALGQRRAESVLKYLAGLGVDAETVRTLSYGEERPADPNHDEAAWARNRRVEFVLP